MKKKVLFLIRAYNDMDHFAPIMWKAAKEGFSVYYFFVDSWRAMDYRKTICDEVGAIEIRSKLIAWYHYNLKEKIKAKILTRILDGLFCIVVGSSILIRLGVNRLVVEWCGPSGREMGRYLLVAGRYLRIRTVSMPHGYHIWRNKLVTWEMVRDGSEDAKYDFSERIGHLGKVILSRLGCCIASKPYDLGRHGSFRHNFDGIGYHFSRILPNEV